MPDPVAQRSETYNVRRFRQAVSTMNERAVTGDPVIGNPGDMR